ncbi:MAG: chromate transporter [Eubacteriales bacterium]|nr:chromate transporter [Eubacteriales bacterium]
MAAPTVTLSFIFEGDFTNKKRNLLHLFLEFAKFGCFTFGGGWSIIAQMQQLYVDKRKEITSQELLDLASVAKSLPGTMISNVAMLYGYRVGGLAGGFSAVFGMILPPLAVILVISYFYAAFRTNPWVNAAMEGMQAAVVPIIFSAAVNLVKGSMPYPPCVLLLILSVAAYLFTDWSPIVLVILGVVLGMVIGSWYERRQPHDPA